MKLCIPSTGKGLQDRVDPRFGRAPYFQIIDTRTNSVEVIENTEAASAGGAGISAARIVLNRGVEGVLAGRIGPQAMGVFQAAGCKLFEGISPAETVQEVLTRFQGGEYTTAEESSQPTPRVPLGGGRVMAGGGGGRGMGGGGRGGMGGGGGRG